MENWLIFFMTLGFRFFGGFVMGCIVGFIYNWHKFMFGVANKQLPWGLLKWWGIVGGLILMLTVPKENRPWGTRRR